MPAALLSATCVAASALLLTSCGGGADQRSAADNPPAVVLTGVSAGIEDLPLLADGVVLVASWSTEEREDLTFLMVFEFLNEFGETVETLTDYREGIQFLSINTIQNARFVRAIHDAAWELTIRPANFEDAIISPSATREWGDTGPSIAFFRPAFTDAVVATVTTRDCEYTNMEISWFDNDGGATKDHAGHSGAQVLIPVGTSAAQISSPCEWTLTW